MMAQRSTQMAELLSPTRAFESTEAVCRFSYLDIVSMLEDFFLLIGGIKAMVASKHGRSCFNV